MSMRRPALSLARCLNWSSMRQAHRLGELLIRVVRSGAQISNYDGRSAFLLKAPDLTPRHRRRGYRARHASILHSGWVGGRPHHHPIEAREGQSCLPDEPSDEIIRGP